MKTRVLLLFLVVTSSFLQGMEEQSLSKKRKRIKYCKTQQIELDPGIISELKSCTHFPIIKPLFNNIEADLIDLIHNEQEGICIAMYSITSENIASALISAVIYSNVSITLVVDAEQAKNKKMRDIVTDLCQRNISVFKYPSSTVGSMHHKFCIFKKNIADRSFVVTGSYNFTYAAEKSNHENMVVIGDINTEMAYEREFENLLEKSTKCRPKVESEVQVERRRN